MVAIINLALIIAILIVLMKNWKDINNTEWKYLLYFLLVVLIGIEILNAIAIE